MTIRRADRTAETVVLLGEQAVGIIAAAHTDVADLLNAGVAFEARLGTDRVILTLLDAEAR